jgi:hypothetical protein
LKYNRAYPTNCPINILCLGLYPEDRRHNSREIRADMIPTSKLNDVEPFAYFRGYTLNRVGPKPTNSAICCPGPGKPHKFRLPSIADARAALAMLTKNRRQGCRTTATATARVELAPVML